MSRTPTISRNLLSDQVKEYLIEEILGGRYPPGARVVETRIAKALGVSQGPVREALRDLVGLGIVDITAFEGARVRRGSKRELLEAYEVRAELESLGARRAQIRMSPAACIELRNLVDEMQEAAARGDFHAEARLDGAFHGRIMEISDNRMLKRAWESLEPVSRTYITLATAVVTPELVANLHLPIVESLLQQEAEVADEAVRRHFRAVAAMFDALFVDGAASEDAGRRSQSLEPTDAVTVIARQVIDARAPGWQGSGQGPVSSSAVGEGDEHGQQGEPLSRRPPIGTSSIP